MLLNQFGPWQFILLPSWSSFLLLCRLRSALSSRLSVLSKLAEESLVKNHQCNESSMKKTGLTFLQPKDKWVLMAGRTFYFTISIVVAPLSLLPSSCTTWQVLSYWGCVATVMRWVTVDLLVVSSGQIVVCEHSTVQEAPASPMFSRASTLNETITHSGFSIFPELTLTKSRFWLAKGSSIKLFSQFMGTIQIRMMMKVQYLERPRAVMLGLCKHWTKTSIWVAEYPSSYLYYGSTWTTSKKISSPMCRAQCKYGVR